MLNAVPVRLRAVLADPMFAVSVLFCALLCSSAVIYTDAQNLNDYTAFTAPIYFSRAEMRTDLSFSAESVLRSCGAGWLGLFLPITSAFAWVQCFCVRRESGVMRFETVRQSRLSHAAADYLSGLLAGAVSCLLGLLLFAAAVYLVYPSFGDYAEPLREEYLEFQRMLYGREPTTAFGAVLIERALFLALSGMTFAAPAMAFGAVVRSPFTVLCIPFFLSYALQKLNEALPYAELSAAGIRWLLAAKPGALLWAEFAQDGLTEVLLLRGALCVGCFVVFLILEVSPRD